MKKFLNKRWLGLPIGVIATVLLAVAVAAAVYVTTIQPVTQEITAPPPYYGTITADPVTLPSVYAGGSFSKAAEGGVQVDLGPDGAGKALKMVCNPDSKYSSFGVTVTLTSIPAGSTVGLYGYGITGGGEVSVDLDVPGLYIFDQTIEGVAGGGIGTALSTVTFTLEDSTTPPGP